MRLASGFIAGASRQAEDAGQDGRNEWAPDAHPINVYSAGGRSTSFKPRQPDPFSPSPQPTISGSKVLSRRKALPALFRYARQRGHERGPTVARPYSVVFPSLSEVEVSWQRKDQALA
jgi:hypothetical protein